MNLKLRFLQLKKIVTNAYFWGTIGGIFLFAAGTITLFKKESVYDLNSFLEEFLPQHPGVKYELVSPDYSSSRKISYLVYNPETFSIWNSVFLEINSIDEKMNLEALKKAQVSFQREHSLFDDFLYRPLLSLTLLASSFLAIMMMISFNHSIKTRPPKKMRTVNYTNENGEEKSKLEEASEEESEKLIKFSDVAGITEVKDQVQEIVELIKDSSKILEMGGKVPKGIILHGPPGTGKTMLAKATANESAATFLSASGSEFLEIYVGMGAKRIRELFNRAKNLSPCIIFIDEIDAIGGKRGMDNNSEREQALNQLLTEMDGFAGNENVFVFAATNQLDKLDSALLRPGRFDRQIYVPLPDINGRQEILEVYLKKSKTDDSIKIETLAKITSGFSGADLFNLINEAIIFAARNKKEVISQNDLLWAKDKIIMGIPRKLQVSDLDKKHTAYHEIGHAFVCHKLQLDKLVNISIIPRGMALGVTQIETEDVLSIEREKAIHQLAMLLGGRVAEKIFFGKLSTGASNDLQRVYELSHSMVTKWGMSKKLGPLAISNYQLLSEKTKQLIDSEISSIISESENLAESLILKDKDLVQHLSEELLKKGEISGGEFHSLILEKSSVES